MSIMSEATFQELWPRRNLDNTPILLKGAVVGCCYVNL